MLGRLLRRLLGVSSEDDGTAWDLIPSWQYGGRFVEAGGNTVAEQEDAVEEVHERASELEEANRR